MSEKMTDLTGVARAIWSIRREHEDRCDMELEDMGRSHPVWDEAKAVCDHVESRLAPPEPEEASFDAVTFIRKKVEDFVSENTGIDPDDISDTAYLTPWCEQYRDTLLEVANEIEAARAAQQPIAQEARSNAIGSVDPIDGPSSRVLDRSIAADDDNIIGAGGEQQRLVSDSDNCDARAEPGIKNDGITHQHMSAVHEASVIGVDVHDANLSPTPLTCSQESASGPVAQIDATPAFWLVKDDWNSLRVPMTSNRDVRAYRNGFDHGDRMLIPFYAAPPAQQVGADAWRSEVQAVAQMADTAVSTANPHDMRNLMQDVAERLTQLLASPGAQGGE